VHAGGTRLMSLETQLTPATPLVENSGVGSAISVGNALDGGGLKWKANLSIAWSYADLTLGWATRFFDSYFLNIDHTVVTAQGSATVPSQTYHDLFGSYRFNHVPRLSVLDDLELAFGVRNVFNKKPPIDVVGQGVFAAFAPGYSYYGDPRLATYYLTVRKAFGGRD